MIWLTLLLGCNVDTLTPGADKDQPCPDDVAIFQTQVWEPVLGTQCAVCHVEGGVAHDAALRLDPDDLQASLISARNMGENLLLKPLGQHADGHGGGDVVLAGSREADALEFWVNWGLGDCTAPEIQGCFDASTPRRLRRLTHTEYGRSVGDLLNVDASEIVGRLAADPEVSGFKNDAAALVVGSLLAEQYRTTAEEIAWMAPLPGDCGADAACAQATIEDLGFHTFRRPLTASEVEAYQDLWATVAAEDGFEEGIRWTIAAILQSPHFLYRSELGIEEDGQYTLTSWEVATELSYTFWGTTPDDELLDAAADGFTPQTLDDQTLRLATDPRAPEAVADLVDVWLHLDLLKSVSREGLTDEMRATMASDTRNLVMDVALSDGTLSDLMGASLLTQPALLTTHARPSGSSPVHRGVLIRERLLCEDLPPPPANLDTSPPEVDPTLSTRDRYEVHSNTPECAGCHTKIDPLGFGFEAYDQLGNWRDNDAGHAIDDSGDVDGIPFTGPMELSDVLIDDPRFRTCFVQTWRRHATGAEACAEDPGDVTLMGPLLEMAHLPGFTARTAPAGEGDTLAQGTRPDLEPPDDVEEPLPDSFELTEVSNWGTGYCSDGVVTNTGTTPWTWEVRAVNVGTISSYWNAYYVMDGADALWTGEWNATLNPGEQATFGFCADF